MFKFYKFYAIFYKKNTLLLYKHGFVEENQAWICEKTNMDMGHNIQYHMRKGKKVFRRKKHVRKINTDKIF